MVKKFEKIQSKQGPNSGRELARSTST